MDGVRSCLLAALGVLEAGLDRLDAARSRVELRRFLKAHPEVNLYYPDGELK